MSSFKTSVDNPLDNLTPEELKQAVAAFHLNYSLISVVDEKLLQKGARIAQSPRTFEAIEEVTEEKQILRDEHMRLIRQPSAFWVTICSTCIAAALQGWDQTGTNGANLEWPAAFDLDTEVDSGDLWILGLVIAAPCFASSMMSCWLSDPLDKYVARRGTIFAAVLCCSSVIGAAFTQNWVQLLFCRCLLCIGMGSKASTVPVYAAENSAAFFRGSFVVDWQLWFACGIVLGSSANLAVYQMREIGWRLRLGSALIPALPLLILIWWAPESPRWSMQQDCYPQAYHSLLSFRNVPLQTARDLYYSSARMELENIMLAAKQQAQNGNQPEEVRGLKLSSLALPLFRDDAGDECDEYFGRLNILIKSGSKYTPIASHILVPRKPATTIFSKTTKTPILITRTHNHHQINPAFTDLDRKDGISTLKEEEALWSLHGATERLRVPAF
ncbi:hypothetical protein B0J12DRAFT_586247 [Macrophomina phaseolina]|uniref:Major facilitator superfamily (MFS) profile domain-containing protein n=1 Tax=Macrophomina phaseolina TaxID=35725 RepID=A0ABQ8FRL1_9PEZI|nr:hypothetical protein B0J12DRAFT_586247 [Macrophomina phaseolina]